MSVEVKALLGALAIFLAGLLTLCLPEPRAVPGPVPGDTVVPAAPADATHATGWESAAACLECHPRK